MYTYGKLHVFVTLCNVSELAYHVENSCGHPCVHVCGLGQIQKKIRGHHLYYIIGFTYWLYFSDRDPKLVLYSSLGVLSRIILRG